MMCVSACAWKCVFVHVRVCVYALVSMCVKNGGIWEQNVLFIFHCHNKHNDTSMYNYMAHYCDVDL